MRGHSLIIVLLKKGTIALKCNKRKITYMLQLLELKDIFIFVTLKKERCLGVIGRHEKNQVYFLTNCNVDISHH